MIKRKLHGYKDLDVYKLAFKIAMELFVETKKFPKDEKYALTDQMRRSSRSIAANISEAWGKRMYRSHFVSKLSDSYAETNETVTWLDFALSHGYINRKRYEYFNENYDYVCRMLFSMMKNPDKFILEKKEKSVESRA